jgi:hypothetical protein
MATRAAADDPDRARLVREIGANVKKNRKR